MAFIDEIKAKAKASKKTIVLPESMDKRTFEAAEKILKEGIANLIIIGTPEEIEKNGAGFDITGATIVDPFNDPNKQKYIDKFVELRAKKGMTPEKAKEILLNQYLYYGVMMVKMGDADGLVSGAVHSTGDMLRPALQIIKTKPEMKLVSSSFLMDCPDKSLGEDGLLVYADCVVVPCPSAEELARIAIAAADTAKRLCGFEEPRVAMLSFSTMGSAKHALVDKVRDAVKIAHELAPDLLLDGEMQFDAALVPEIAAGKAKGSPVAGRANVLIFPDLQAGNIGYKITQRIGGADCFAVLQGLNKPCNDLSRGCSVEDIVNTAAMTAVQAQAM